MKFCKNKTCFEKTLYVLLKIVLVPSTPTIFHYHTEGNLATATAVNTSKTTLGDRVSVCLSRDRVSVFRDPTIWSWFMLFSNSWLHSIFLMELPCRKNVHLEVRTRKRSKIGHRTREKEQREQKISPKLSVPLIFTESTFTGFV